MVILELGIIKSGIPLVSKQYYKDYNIKVSPVLRGGFFSGLDSFVEQTFSEEIECFVLKNFKILFVRHTINEPKQFKLIFYCIGDKELNPKIAKKALTRVLDEFIHNFGALEKFTGDLSIFKEFQQTIDEILGDLIKKPNDRIRSIF